MVPSQSLSPTSHPTRPPLAPSKANPNIVIDPFPSFVVSLTRSSKSSIPALFYTSLRTDLPNATCYKQMIQISDRAVNDDELEASSQRCSILRHTHSIEGLASRYIPPVNVVLCYRFFIKKFFYVHALAIVASQSHIPSPLGILACTLLISTAPA